MSYRNNRAAGRACTMSNDFRIRQTCPTSPVKAQVLFQHTKYEISGPNLLRKLPLLEKSQFSTQIPVTAQPLMARKARVIGLRSPYDGQIREARAHMSQPSLPNGSWCAAITDCCSTSAPVKIAVGFTQPRTGVLNTCALTGSRICDQR